LSVLRKLASIKRNGGFRVSVEQLRRLEQLRSGQLTITDAEEEPSPPSFIADIRDVEVFVDEGGPAMFECRVEPKHDLNLEVRWYHDGEELVSDGRIKICHEYGHASLHIFYTYPEDEGTYICKATNEIGEMETSAELICRPLPQIRFETPALQEDRDTEIQLIKEAAARNGVRAKLHGDEVYEEGEDQVPRFLLRMDHYPKLLAGQPIALQTFVVPVGDPDLKIEWFLNGEPLLFKSSFNPSYDHGVLSLSINKVYPDDFGEFSVRATNRYGEAELSSWVGETGGLPEAEQDEPDLPAWCNKVEKGRLAVECPPEITKHLVDIEIGETSTVKLEVALIGNPRPEVIWSMEGEELVNSRHVQIREKEGRTTLILINISADMAGEYRCTAVSNLGSDMTEARIGITPLTPEELAKQARIEEEGLRQLVQSEERKLLEKKRRKQEKEQKQRETREKAKRKH